MSPRAQTFMEMEGAMVAALVREEGTEREATDPVMSARVPSFPDVVSERLVDLVGAFRDRSKAIKHRVSRWEIAGSHDSHFERIDFDFLYLDTQVRVSAWEDGSIWFRACEGGKHSWKFNYAFDAQMKDAPAPLLVEAFEESLIYIAHKSKVMSLWEEFDPTEDHL